MNRFVVVVVVAWIVAVVNVVVATNVVILAVVVVAVVIALMIDLNVIDIVPVQQLLVKLFVPGVRLEPNTFPAHVQV